MIQTNLEKQGACMIKIPVNFSAGNESQRDGIVFKSIDGAVLYLEGSQSLLDLSEAPSSGTAAHTDMPCTAGITDPPSSFTLVWSRGRVGVAATPV